MSGLLKNMPYLFPDLTRKTVAAHTQGHEAPAARQSAVKFADRIFAKTFQLCFYVWGNAQNTLHTFRAFVQLLLSFGQGFFTAIKPLMDVAVDKTSDQSAPGYQQH